MRSFYSYHSFQKLPIFLWDFQRKIWSTQHLNHKSGPNFNNYWKIWSFSNKSLFKFVTFPRLKFWEWNFSPNDSIKFVYTIQLEFSTISSSTFKLKVLTKNIFIYFLNKFNWLDDLRIYILYLSYGL